MEIFKKNCSAIETKNKELAARLLAREGASVELEPTRSDDFTFKYGGIYFHSRYDPWKEALLQAEEIMERKSDWVMLFGLGCGYLLRTLIEKKKEKVIVFEPSMEILTGVLKKIDLSDCLRKEHIVLVGDLIQVAEAVRGYPEGHDDILSYKTVSYSSNFPRELQEFTNRIFNAHITNQVGIKTDIESRLIWIENYFDNIGHLPEYPPLDSLRDRLKGVPLVIVGAGPSLKKNAGLLKEFKGKAVIVAAITAYKPLLKYGVVPDFIIASEKVDLPEYFTYGEEDMNTRLILAEISHTDMFSREVKDKFVFFNPYMYLSAQHARLWGSAYMLSSGGSVTTAALDAGIMFGCDPVVFIGQDLCFGENETHAPGGVYISQDVKIDREKGTVSIEEDYVTLKEKARSCFNLQWLKGLNGKPVPSKFDWVTFHQWFESYIGILKQRGNTVKVINATEGGAYIEGMEHTTLKDVLDRYVHKEVDLDGVISTAVTDRRAVDYDGLIASFEDMQRVLKNMNGIAAVVLKEVRAAKRLFEKNGLSPELRKNADRIKRLEERLFDAGGSSFIWESLVENTYNLKSDLRDDAERNDSGRFKKALDDIRASYTKIVAMCRKYRPVLDKTIKTLKQSRSSASATGNGCCSPSGVHQCDDCACTHDSHGTGAIRGKRRAV
ncbi:MAG: motility associated factor glycosyltransferase family protein [Deltaproteobacteria bacterium]|nr:motility associated factor glycosyltransferase family protein [Deltaproteobacteria bacterium]